jgi:drug/metabolite transporter (DMT)-like permease
MTLPQLVGLLVLAALWGGSFLFLRIAAPVLGPVWLIELRVLLAGIALLPVVMRLGLIGDLRRYLKPLLILGSLNVAIPFVLFAYASLSLPAGFTSILNATTPLFGVAIGQFGFKESLSSKQLFGLGLGFAGVVVLVGWQPIVPTLAFYLAVVAGLVAALLYAIAVRYANHAFASVSPLVTTTGCQLGSALLLLPILPLSVPTGTMSGGIVLAVLGLALLSTTCAFLLFFHLLKQIGSTKVLTVTYLIPLFAIAWGALILKEAITPSMILGCGLVLLGTAITNDLLMPASKK